MDCGGRMEDLLAYSLGWMHAITETVLLHRAEFPSYRSAQDAEQIRRMGVERYHLHWHGELSEASKDAWARGWWQGWIVGSRTHAERLMAIQQADQARTEVHAITEAWAVYREYGTLWQPEADKRKGRGKRPQAN